MSKKSNLKMLIIILVIINIIYIIMFNGFLIRETWLIRKNGSFYCLSQSLDDYKISKIKHIMIPVEVSSELINSSDYINNLKENAINLTLIFAVVELIQVIIIIVLIVDYKTQKDINIE